MHYVLVLMAVTIIAVLVCVVVVATGRGGEMAHFPNDYAPPDFGALAATDVALLRPPTALWGYNMQATDEALSGIASALSARDIRIASLERQVADLRAAQRAMDEDHARMRHAATPGARHAAASAEHPRDPDDTHGGSGGPAPAPAESAPAGAGWPGGPKGAAPALWPDVSRPKPQRQPDASGSPSARPRADAPSTRPHPDEEDAW